MDWTASPLQGVLQIAGLAAHAAAQAAPGISPVLHHLPAVKLQFNYWSNISFRQDKERENMQMREFKFT